MVSPRVSAATTNLIANPSVESQSGNMPANFQTNSWGSNTPTFSEVAGHTGSYALSVTVSKYASGDAKWIADQVPVTTGQSYTYSDYNQSNVPTELDAAFVSTSGAMSFVYLQTISPSSSWQQTSTTFTVPVGVVSVSIFHIIYSNGTLLTDDFSLTPSTQTTPPSDPANLIANSSFETANGTDPASWNRGGWGTNTATLSYVTGGAHTGNRSIEAKISNYTSGDTKWYATPVAVVPGSTYTYSDYYKSGVPTLIVAALTNTNGVDSYQDLTTAPVATSWTAYSDTITIPAGIQAITIYHLLNTVGVLDIDDTSLTVTGTVTTPPVTNYIPNSSVESGNSTGPTGWNKDNWGTNTAAFSYVNGDAHTGSRSTKVTISNYASGDAKWYFAPITTLTPGSQYKYSVWYKTNTSPSAVATYLDAQGVSHYFDLSILHTGGETTSSAWQQYSSTFEVPSDAVALSIFFLINSNGWLQTDDASITPYTPIGFNEPMISLTFDDGWSSIYNYGLPLLQKYGFVSTQYLISGYLNQPSYMTTAQAQAFQAAGSEIGSHTVSHPDLTTLTSAQLTSELADSQTTLRQLFGSSVAADFASPYGSYNDTVIAAIQQYYQSHRSVNEGYNTKDNFDPYDILVQNITTSTTPADVADWVANASAENAWLVIVYHNVNPTGVFDDYTVSTANLDAELQIVKNSGIPVKTTNQALTEINSQL
ncbi:MAG: hypothetical protein JWN26_714 [Candidatus Saccharibacteria bacterium]|nr:hypothetical protein [Candidatus Saccharibacteria bacterium]